MDIECTFGLAADFLLAVVRSMIVVVIGLLIAMMEKVSNRAIKCFQFHVALDLHWKTNRCLVTVFAFDNMLILLVADIDHGTTNKAWHDEFG